MKLSKIGKEFNDAAEKIEGELFAQAGISPKLYVYLTLCIKIGIFIFVVCASIGFYQFYMEFQELGCDSYCKTKTLEIENKSFIIIPTEEQNECSNLSNPSHSENLVPKPFSYQSLS